MEKDPILATDKCVREFRGGSQTGASVSGIIDMTRPIRFEKS